MSAAGRPRNPRGGGRPRAEGRTARAGGPPRRLGGSAGKAGTDRRQPDKGLGGEQVEGRQAVRELLAARRRPVRSVLMAEGMDESAILDEIESLASANKVRIEHVPRRRLDSTARTDAPQGVIGLARPIEAVELDSLCEPTERGAVPFLLVLDGISDPHNLGSLLRSAECAGATGVVLPRHRSAHLSPTVTKVAAGAVEHLPFALVAGVPSALDRLSALGVWTVGLAAGAAVHLQDVAVVDGPLALVVGSEGVGLSRLAARRCDVVAGIPLYGTLPSLNAAVAGAVACFEIARRRPG